MDETPLWYLKHEDYWLVHSALTDYSVTMREAAARANSPMMQAASDRAVELQRKLREVR